VNAISYISNISKRKPILFLFFALLALSLNVYSQFQPTPVKRSNNQITINGKDYFLHEVLKGQTLYGISKEYRVSEEEIKKLNPDLNQRSVFPGMVLRIPDAGTPAAPQKIKEKDDGNFINHTVLAKENFFSISRQYGIKIDELRESNPEARGGLKTGQIIRIPKDRISISQKTQVTEVEAAKDPQVNADQDLEMARSEQPCRVKPFPHVNDNFHLAILLPLNISQNDTLIYSDTLKTSFFRFYEFLEGIYLAIDSMRLEGLNLTAEVFDTEKNPETIRGIISEGKLNEADLIIGPVFPYEIDVVAAFAKSKHIAMVSPFSTIDVLNDNPFAFQIRNSLPRQVELATTYLGSKYKQNMVVIGRMSEKDDPEFKRFLAMLRSQIEVQDPAKAAVLKTVYYSEISKVFTNAESKTVELDHSLSTTLPNFIILPSEKEVFITEVINELNQKSTTHNIHVFGLNQWVFTDLDLGNLYNVNLELYTDFEDYPFVDYADPQVLSFCDKYRENWNTEPSWYSFHGFDITYYFMKALFEFGRNLTASVPCWPEYLNHTSMLTPFRFGTKNRSDGFENNAMAVIRFQKDELLRKKVN
jgi:LysM repeat protein